MVPYKITFVSNSFADLHEAPLAPLDGPSAACANEGKRPPLPIQTRIQDTNQRKVSYMLIHSLRYLNKVITLEQKSHDTLPPDTPAHRLIMALQMCALARSVLGISRT